MNRLIAIVGVSLLVVSMLVGCVGTANQVDPDSQPAESITQAVPVEVEEATAPQVAKLASTEASWRFERSDGFSMSTLVTVWEKVPSAMSDSFQHPSDSGAVLELGAGYDPQTDAAIPFRVQIRNDTPTFDLPDARTQLILTGGSLEGKDLSISMDHPKMIDVMVFFSDGARTEHFQTYTSERGLVVAAANTNDSAHIINWSSVPPNGTAGVSGFVILHNYYDPASPDGATALVESLALTLGTMDSWQPQSSSDRKSLSLSGKVVEYD